MNNRGNIVGLAFFIVVLLSLIIVAPIILKVGTEALGKTSDALSVIDTTNVSSGNVDYVKGQFTGTFDWIVMFLVLINILLLLVTSFLIDVHPAFLVIYLLGAFFLVVTLPYTAAVAEKMYDMCAFSGIGAGCTENGVIQYIPMTNFLLNNFGVVIVGVFFLTGIIMYAKLKYSSNAGTSGGGY